MAEKHVISFQSGRLFLGFLTKGVSFCLLKNKTGFLLDLPGQGDENVRQLARRGGEGKPQPPPKSGFLQQERPLQALCPEFFAIFLC